MPEQQPRQAAHVPLALPAFGPIEPERVLTQDDLFAIVRDNYPVAPGHTLIMPRRLVQRYRQLTTSEKAQLLKLVDWAQHYLEATLSPAPDGFNLGVNDGEAAGQTVPQFHFHVIPRYTGDVVDPRGGVRWVIPCKARYW